MDLSKKTYIPFNKLAPQLLKLMCVILLLQLTGFAQAQERMIDKVSWRHEPIQVVSLKTRDKSIELGKRFSEDDDWLRGLTVTVQNVSNKAIARIEIMLTFPRPGNGSSPETALYMIGMVHGKEPAEVAPDEVLKLVLPGEMVEVKLREVNLPAIKEDLAKLGYAQPIKHAQIMILSVTFVDGSEWAGGDDILYPNPNNPKQKINPRFPLEWQIPQESRAPPEQAKAPYQSFGFGFLNAGLKRAHAPPQLIFQYHPPGTLA
jgi:hypothetical protein